ncbi:MAG: hypothetical protein COA74_13380 [Gammaproteobacteria bacterium]|nr:MAG: hypothetical protein COA74_13380 [Gammaproteobacteria bacterium]
MNIQKLLQEGYNLTDIKALLLIFINNINDYKLIFTQNDEKNTIASLHKLKGGLILLEYEQLVDFVNKIEKDLKTYGINKTKSKIINLIDDCYQQSLIAMSNLDSLIKTSDINL